MKTDLVYTPTNTFETFVIPKINSQLKVNLLQLGNNYLTLRDDLMQQLLSGLTKIYSYYHSKEIIKNITSESLMTFENKTIEKQFGKEASSLWIHLRRNEATCSFEEAVKGIVKLRELHVEMDKAVLEAYGWQDIDLRHDFYEVDYLPENDRVRFTIHPDARKEVLKRLLELNHKIHEEEVKAGLWDEKKTKKKKTEKPDSNGDQVSEPEGGYGDLFNQN